MTLRASGPVALSLLTALLIMLVLLAGCDKLEWQTLISSLPTPTASATSITSVKAVYLAFERGFMVYIDGADCAYAYADGILIPVEIARQEFGMYHYCLPYSALPAAPQAAPDDPFGRLWTKYEELRQGLGNAVGSAVHYQAVIPPREPVIMGGVFYLSVVTLPDGRALYCGHRAATAGSCQLRS